MQGQLEEVTLLQDITEACRTAVRAFVAERTDEQDQVSISTMNMFAKRLGRGGATSYEEVLKVLACCTPR